MPTAHDALITLAKKLGYPHNDKGLCHGVTLRCLEAYHLGEQDKFINRINKIRDTENLADLIREAQEKVKQHETLTPNERELLEILSFYDSLLLYQKPREHHNFFNEALSQLNTDKISCLAGSEGIQSQGGLLTFYSEPNSFTKQELSDYLGNLQKIISDDTLNVQCNLSMLLSSDDHAMGLFYQPKRHTWTFMDINQWPPLEVIFPLSSESNRWSFLNLFSMSPIDKLAESIRRGFDSETNTTFNMKLISTHAESARLQALNAKLNQLTNLYPVTRVISQDKNNHAALLYIAAKHGHIEVVKALLAAGADPNQARDDGITPLFAASVKGHVEVVKVLLAGGADPNQARAEDGATPLLVAAQDGHVEVVKALLADPRILPNKATADGATPLFIAAQQGYAEVVTALLDVGADPNLARDDDGVTPLLAAAQNGHIKVVTALLDAGADPNLAKPNGATPLYLAAQKGHVEVVKALLAAGADPNLAMTDGATPLFVAAQYGHAEVVTAFLVGSRTDPNQAMTSGLTPLLFAAAEGHAEVVTALLENPRTDLNLAMTDDGITPLFIAAEKGHGSVVTALLAAGADPNKTMADGATLLYTTILFGHLEIAQRLLQHPKIEVANSALISASQTSYVELVQVMLSNEESRTCYLKQILMQAELMQDAFLKNDIFLTTLMEHRNELWAQLQDPEALGLSADEHKVLLENILCSKQESDVKRQHPLYNLFKEESQAETSDFSRFKAQNKALKEPSHSILDDIEIYLKATYPESQAGPGRS